MKPNTAVITLERLKELEAYEEAINKRLSVKIKADIITNKGHEEIKRQKEIIRCDNNIIASIAKVNEDLKNKIKKLEDENKGKVKPISQYSDSELEEEVLKRLRARYFFPNFYNLSVYFREDFIDKRMITTMSVWEFLRWKKRKKKESISFKLP